MFGHLASCGGQVVTGGERLFRPAGRAREADVQENVQVALMRDSGHPAKDIPARTSDNADQAHAAPWFDERSSRAIPGVQRAVAGPADLIPSRLHSIDQCELRPAPFQILSWMLDSVVSVALQVIGQEAEPHDEGEHSTRFGDQCTLCIRHHGGDLAEKTIDDGLECIQVQIHALGIRVVLSRGSRRGPDKIAEVVQETAGTHRIEVNHAEGSAGPGIEEHIVRFGIVVHDSLRNPAGCESFDEDACLPALRLQHIDLPADFSPPPTGVRREGGIEAAIPVPGVMEGMDRLVEPGSGKAVEEADEAAGSPGDLPGCFGTLHQVEGERMFDEIVAPPVFTLVVSEKERPIPGRDDSEHPAVGVLSALRIQSVAHVSKGTVDVLHDTGWISKYEPVDTLVEKAPCT